ncbi:proline--tRNA ligase [Geomicrobium sp. JCM 19037]|uniref:proline--tRNA ligase n=1 Tax=Geomicrobium sp. JCM 19037 TaxID=1460634 RepID=UPI0005AB5B6B|nr:proline--tRNA ligase [Geomicrobium sp. JCM 19037]
MRQQTFFSPTMRDVPADAEAVSHQLMLRAGLIRQNAAGIYSYLPLGQRMIQKIQTVVREEMDNTGAQELLMPAIQPAELWEESGRLQDYGPELVRLHDRHERPFVLGPTHEEVITSLVRDGVTSYKRLPMNLYQIQTKYRDERRPRFGLLRGREFIMKDSYSFSITEEELDEEYWRMFATYERIFSRLGLNFRAVEADGGAISGSSGQTHEFQALADIGEDTIAYSDGSNFAANIEIAATHPPSTDRVGEEQPLLKTALTTVENQEQSAVVTSTLFFVEDAPVLAVAQKGDDISDVKLGAAIGSIDVVEASIDQVQSLFNVQSNDDLGPVDVPSDVRVLFDHRLEPFESLIAGANETGQAYVHVNAKRDVTDHTFADIRLIKEGDPSPDGKGTIQFAQGIEIGQVFKLGTKYSETLKAEVLDDNGRSTPLTMGCYGIGISRTLAAIVEQHHDERGIAWPKEAAPFDVHLLVLNAKNEEQVALSDTLYETLKTANYDVLYDDRKERAGVKFNDSDLFGLPVRISVGKRAGEGIVEVKDRKSGDMMRFTLMSYWFS